MRKVFGALLLLMVLFVSGCKEYKMPEGVTPIEDFKLQSYLGTWYEIARLEHKFEKGMEAITATYSMRQDGGVKVENRGFHTLDQAWRDAQGRAYFVDDPKRGFLKVSFFGPFYGSYIVMDTDYKSYTMISGPDHSYFWILSRTPTLPKATLDRLIAKAKEAGFDTTALIYPDQSYYTEKR
jgi:apolipoprotein D and lipocalin family protein